MTRSVADINAEIHDVVDRLGAPRAERRIARRRAAGIKGSPWMPKPAEFRKLVQARFDERLRRRERCRAMLDAHGVPTGRKGFEREAEPVRLRGSRDAVWRIGNVAKAAHYERRLAVIETREPGAWAVEAGRAR